MNQAIYPAKFPETLAQFEQWEPNDGFKYEWNDGEIIKSEKMNRKHLKLLKKLARLFLKTKAHKSGGELIAEQDVRLTGVQLRRPDIAYFSAEQIENSDHSSAEEPIPGFAIEVISTSDQLTMVKAKLKEYFDHGVMVVWLVYPDEKLVEVYTSYKQVTICTDKDVCSAKPVMDDFEIRVEDLFS
jgi:Uma2 family endonuclease